MAEPPGSTAVALMVRVPIPGQVKTRLAAAIGDTAASTLYRALVSDILGGMLASGLPLVLFHDGEEAAALPKLWRQAASQILPQVKGDIGQRMAAAFGHCFDEGFSRVILIGSDLPDLDARVLAIAAAALENHDAVIAPALDGGYGLIGLQQKSFRAELFQNIAWSTDQVLAQSLRQLQRFGLSTSQLAPLRDIDDLADLQAWFRGPGRRPTAFHQTLEELRRAGRLPDPAATPPGENRMIVRILEGKPASANTYIIAAKPGGLGLIIDPGVQAERILEHVKAMDLTIAWIVLTHAHIDHCSGLDQVRKATGRRFAACVAETDEAASQPRLIIPGLQFIPFRLPFPPDRALADGDLLAVDGLRLTVLHTPGHSPDSICLYGHGKLFSGDTLLKGRIGVALPGLFPGHDHALLRRSITQRLLTLPDDTLVYPGHGHPTTIGEERQTNPMLHG